MFSGENNNTRTSGRKGHKPQSSKTQETAKMDNPIQTRNLFFDML